MELTWNAIVWCVICFTPILIHLFRRRKPNNFPPGPPGYPIIGNIVDLSGSMPHRDLARMKEKYGPIIGLKIGSARTVVISSAKTAAEFFKNHDLSFADRAIVDSMRCHDYHKRSLGLAPHGTYWRVLRRICTVDMLVAKRINETAPIRRKCVDQMLAWLDEEARKPHTIDVGHFIYLTLFNMVGNLMLSRDLLDPNSKEGSEFCKAMHGMIQWAGKANMSDAFPWLRWLDLQGVRRRVTSDMGDVLRITSGFLKERMEERKKGVEHNRPKDFLDVLIEFEGDGKDELTKLSEQEITVVVLELFIAASETTSSTTEWILAELFHKPECMAKAREELARVVGPNNKVEESHIDDLPYLQAVVKEALRLHPPLPFLLPRSAVKDTKFMGYDIPKGTQVFVNSWAIGRDSEIWEDGNSFKPERFLGSKVEFRGQHHELIPFGAGRRMCPGIPIAHRMLHLIAGSLLHNFDWELTNMTTRELMDVDQTGVSMRKAEPVMAIPTKRVA